MATCTALHDWVEEEAPDGEVYKQCAQCDAIEVPDYYFDEDAAYDAYIEDMMV